MVKRRCSKCNSEFDRKSTYDKHINRKFDCSQSNNNLNFENDEAIDCANICGFVQNTCSFVQNNNSNIDFIKNINSNETNDDVNLNCPYCNKIYSSKSI